MTSFRPAALKTAADSALVARMLAVTVAGTALVCIGKVAVEEPSSTVTEG